MTARRNQGIAARERQGGRASLAHHGGGAPWRLSRSRRRRESAWLSRIWPFDECSGEESGEHACLHTLPGNVRRPRRGLRGVYVFVVPGLRPPPERQRFRWF